MPQGPVLEQVELRVRRAPPGEEGEAPGLGGRVDMVGGGREVHHGLATPCDAVVLTLTDHDVRHELRHALEQLRERRRSETGVSERAARAAREARWRWEQGRRAGRAQARGRCWGS